MRIALAQVNPTVGDLKGNAQKIITNLLRAKELNADIAIFPELAICGYPPEDLLYKKDFIKDNIKALRAVVSGAKNIACIVGFVDADKNGSLYNAAAVINNGVLKGIYHKKYLPNYGVFDERRYFTPGETAPIWEFDKALIGINICEDIWIDQDVCLKQAKAGANMLINISASP